MRFSFINIAELSIKLRCSVQVTGKLGFTDTTASALRLNRPDVYVMFAQDTDDNNQLYMVFISEYKDGAFDIKKSGNYYYLPTGALFESLGYNYKKKNYIFDLVRMTNLDTMAHGEVYKMCLRIKDRKGGNKEVEI